MTSAAPAAGSAQSTPSARDTFLQTLEREHATTVRVLRAYPADRLDLQPHPKSKTARDLAWLFVQEQGLVEKAITTGFDWSAPPSAPPPVPGPSPPPEGPPPSLSPLSAMHFPSTQTMADAPHNSPSVPLS